MLKFFVFLAIYLPFQVALNPSPGIDLASIRILIIGIFFIWLAEGLRKKNILVKKNLHTGLIISFLFISLVSTAIAQNSDWAVRKILFLFSIFPIYFVAAATLDSREKISKVAKYALFGGTAVSLVGLIQFVSQFIFGLDKVYRFWANTVIVPFLGNTFSQAVLENPSWLVNVGGHDYLRATATFPDPHMLSFFLGLLIPLALVFMLTEKNKVFYGSILAILVLCDLATFSRGGYLGLFSGFVFIIVYYWKKIGKRPKVLLAGFATLFVLILLVPNPVSRRYLSTFNLKEGSNKGRIETWRQAARVISENPVIGTGIGNYPLEIKPSANYREPIYAHNAYLDIAAETGIPNALLWIGVLLAAFASFLKISQKDIIFVAFAASILIFSVHSLVETALYSPTVLALLLLIMSFSNYAQHEKIN